MKTCSIISVAVLMVLTNLVGANEADDTTITITGHAAGATPFISNLTLEVSDTAILKSIQFAVDAKPGSVTRPLSATYGNDYLLSRGFEQPPPATCLNSAAARVSSCVPMKADALSGTGVAAHSDAARCRTMPYIFRLTECWNFRQARRRYTDLSQVEDISPLGSLTFPDPQPTQSKQRGKKKGTKQDEAVDST